jgi:hypothetical protein
VAGLSKNNLLEPLGGTFIEFKRLGDVVDIDHGNPPAP